MGPAPWPSCASMRPVRVQSFRCPPTRPSVSRVAASGGKLVAPCRQSSSVCPSRVRGGSGAAGARAAAVALARAVSGAPCVVSAALVSRRPSGAPAGAPRRSPLRVDARFAAPNWSVRDSPSIPPRPTRPAASRRRLGPPMVAAPMPLRGKRRPQRRAAPPPLPPWAAACVLPVATRPARWVLARLRACDKCRPVRA